MSTPSAAFRQAYAEQRASEGRGYRADELLALPFLASGPTAGQWKVRARTFRAFLTHVIAPAAKRKNAPLEILDLGAGNGWFSYRMELLGHRAVAVDVRDDSVDGLGAAEEYIRRGADFGRVQASFDALPIPDREFDVAVFNASLHYATNLPAALYEAVRVVRPSGVLVVLDSPFYAREEDGAAMVRDKRAGAAKQFGARADVLMSEPFIEYLTADRLAKASRNLGLHWERRRVHYPLRYELRPLMARLKGRRCPSRFDLWLAGVP